MQRIEVVLWVGGPDVSARIPLLRGLQRRGLHVAVAGSEDPRVFLETGLGYHQYRLPGGLNPATYVASTWDLYRILRDLTPDIVQVVDTIPGVVAPLAARIAGVPIVVKSVTGRGKLFSHTSDRKAIRRFIYRMLQWAVSKACDITVFQNADDEAYFLAHDLTTPGRHCLIPGSGVDLSSIQSLLPTPQQGHELRRALGCEGTVVTMVSRLVRDKGVLEYVEAARRVRSQAPGTTFLLVGPFATDRGQAIPMEMITSNPDVIVTGARADAVRIMAVSDVFVLPTAYGEGVPRVLLEAGAVGLPLVATDVPGCRDVISQGWNGYLVGVGDAEQLSEKILRLVRDAEERRLLGKRSGDIVRQRFALEKICDAYTALYARLLSGRQSLLPA